MDKIAYYFKEQDPKTIDWNFEVAAAVKEVWGSVAIALIRSARLHHRGHVDRRWEATEGTNHN
jgi:hypothetical protein